MSGGLPVARLVLGLALLTVILVAAAPVAIADELAGSQGTDTSIPATDSAMTQSGRNQFADLKISVNQTANLVNQAVSVTWTGGRPTVAKESPFSENFLQIMQCWGNDDGTVPSNPGPPPEQCVFGAVDAVFGGNPSDHSIPAGFASRRIISRSNWPDFDPSQGALDPVTGNLYRPWRGVTGNDIGVETNESFDPNVAGGAYWLNPDFDAIKTNEIVAARTGVDGNGAELFQVNTGEESNGLGCGQKVQPSGGGAAVIPKCWLVVVPRGTAEEEDAGALTGATPNSVVTSPLSPAAWKNRIAFPLQFDPIESPCALASDQRQLSGNELAATAISSWQPALCTSGAHGPYAYSVVNDATARLQLQSNVPGGAGLIAVNNPFDPSAFASTDPVVYAPLTLSGTVIGFNVERVPLASADAASQLLSGVRVAHMNLTPRLVAKLLSQSYTEQVKVRDTTPPNYTWMAKNPNNMGTDPDFTQFNPEFSTLQFPWPKNFGGLVLPLGNSDQAQQVWQYVLADPEAKAWLDGSPDPWGMKVNPVYATKASVNSTGAAFADPVPNSFPKSDPYCDQEPPIGQDVVPPPVCGNGWLPYAGSLRAAARETRTASDGAKIVENVVAISPDQVWGSDIPQTLGTKSILSLTDSPSAALFGVQTASLSRAGDDGAARQFVAPTVASMTAAVGSMKASTVPAVLQPDPLGVASGAYPLTALTYAAVAPLQLDGPSRKDDAYLLDYAAGAGQSPGLLLGQLPPGYAPLPDALKKQTSAAAQLVRNLTITPSTTTAPKPSRPATTAAPVAGSIAPPAATTPTASTPATLTTPTVLIPGPPVSVQTTPPTTAPTITLTPALGATLTRFFVPGLMAVILLAGLGAMEITKRPRRAGPLAAATPKPGGTDDLVLGATDRPLQGASR